MNRDLCNIMFIKSRAWIWLCIENDLCVHRGATWFDLFDLSFHKLSPTRIICTWRSRNIMNLTSIFVRITSAMYGCVTFTKRVRYVHIGTYTRSMEIFSTSFHMDECIYNGIYMYNILSYRTCMNYDRLHMHVLCQNHLHMHVSCQNRTYRHNVYCNTCTPSYLPTIYGKNRHALPESLPQSNFFDWAPWISLE